MIRILNNTTAHSGKTLQHTPIEVHSCISIPRGYPRRYPSGSDKSYRFPAVTHRAQLHRVHAAYLFLRISIWLRNCM